MIILGKKKRLETRGTQNVMREDTTRIMRMLTESS
jgi:hypothetical protein